MRADVIVPPPRPPISAAVTMRRQDHPYQSEIVSFADILRKTRASGIPAEPPSIKVWRSVRTGGDTKTAGYAVSPS
jgi:hypothetical protein